MPKLPGIPHLQAVRALEKAGFKVVREGKHVVMSDGRRILTIPRHNPINAFTMGGYRRRCRSDNRGVPPTPLRGRGARSNKGMQQTRSAPDGNRGPRS